MNDPYRVKFYAAVFIVVLLLLTAAAVGLNSFLENYRERGNRASPLPPASVAPSPKKPQETAPPFRGPVGEPHIIGPTAPPPGH